MPDHQGPSPGEVHRLDCESMHDPQPPHTTVPPGPRVEPRRFARIAEASSRAVSQPALGSAEQACEHLHRPQQQHPHSPAHRRRDEQQQRPSCERIVCENQASRLRRPQHPRKSSRRQEPHSKFCDECGRISEGQQRRRWRRPPRIGRAAPCWHAGHRATNQGPTSVPPSEHRAKSSHLGRSRGPSAEGRQQHAGGRKHQQPQVPCRHHHVL